LYWEAIGWYSLILILVIALIVLVLTRYSTRRARGTHEPPAHVGEHLMLELAWTAGPAAILLLVAIPAIVINFVSQPNNPPANAMHIEVIGHQWWWEFRYPALGIVTANEAHIPLDRPVYFSLNSGDVIHSFWIPRLGGKRDLIPNHTNELILTPRRSGEYYGECAEFCGLSHANMRFRVFVDSKSEFVAWVADQRLDARQPAPSETNYSQLRAGLKIFAGAPCAICHEIKGVSKGSIAPALTHFRSRTTFAGGTLPNTRQELEKWIENPANLKPGVKMPGLALAPDQLAAVSAYLESLR
jgi:cytochrome c oxidase subunit 2